MRICNSIDLEKKQDPLLLPDYITFTNLNILHLRPQKEYEKVLPAPIHALKVQQVKP